MFGRNWRQPLVSNSVQYCISVIHTKFGRQLLSGRSAEAKYSTQNLNMYSLPWGSPDKRPENAKQSLNKYSREFVLSMLHVWVAKFDQELAELVQIWKTFDHC